MNKRPAIYLSVCVCCVVAIGNVQAQERFVDRYNVSYITMNDGLPHNHIDDICKDSSGFLWISTAGGGLARYDGYEFICFNPNTAHCRLKSNFIRNVCEDPCRRLWIVSEEGTDILDLATLQPLVPDDPEGLLGSILSEPAYIVIRDSQECMWLQSRERLHRITFDAEGRVESRSTLDLPQTSQPDIVLEDMDRDGNVWAGIDNAVVKIVSAGPGKLQAIPVSDALTLRPDVHIRGMLAKENEVWIATDLGLLRYDRNSDAVKLYVNSENDPRSISQNFVTDLVVTADKQLIAGTLRGANIYNPITDDFERLTLASNGESGSERDGRGGGEGKLNSNFINCIRVEGKHIWFGTESGGLNRLTPKRLALYNYRHDRENPASISANPVNAIFEDAGGDLWVGTVEGGLNRKKRGSDRFSHYTYQRGEISHNSVSSIAADNKGHLWVGTWGGGVNILDPESPRRPIRVIEALPITGFPIPFVAVLIHDTVNGGMWVGANRGLFFYDQGADEMVYPFAAGEAEAVRNCLGAVIDRENRLWIGSTDGVYVIDLESRSRHPGRGEFEYRHLSRKLDDPDSGRTEIIRCFCEAKDGTLWLGSDGYGIYKRVVDGQGNESFVSYNTSRGLINDNVRSIQEDPEGNLWIGTNNGLSCFHPAEERFVNYTEQDGLPDAQFYWNASLRSRDGTLWFGSVAGLTAIEKNLPDASAPPANVRFTRLRIGNEEVLPGSKYLPEDIAVTRKIKLHEREKSFSLEFSALDFEPAGTALYSYRLVGFEERWVQVTGERRFAGYTNLPPGGYTMQVKYTSEGERVEGRGEQTGNMAELEIVIRPHFYKTFWFMILVVGLVILSIVLVFRWRMQNLKRRGELLRRTVEERTRQLEQQKKVLENQTGELSLQNRMLIRQNEKITRQKAQISRMAHQVEELTLDRLAFFTNITHEFRTPITLIIGPIERALKLSYNPQVIEQLNFVERNSKYLLSLVNQLMDFRKVESDKLQIVKTTGNFEAFIRSLVTPFEEFARQRSIAIRVCIRMKDPEILYDEGAMNKVVSNLLSNAIKFTPDGGAISLYIATPADKLYICVSDTGTGIPKEDIEQIFDRFYQSKGQTRYPVYGQTGTGIGLYVCKRIVSMLGGEISVRNNPASGCSFRIVVPLSRDVRTEGGGEPQDRPAPALPAAPDALPATPAAETRVLPKEKGTLTILVVEDNADMRGYIHSILRDGYNVLEVANGAEALDILSREPVDFIISDLMMPVMDGIELSRRVKETFEISHIPFLMLTAKTSAEARLESYRTGVDEYLLKPFDETLLLTRIENILDNRRRYRQRFGASMDVAALNLAEPADKSFIDRIMEVVREHYKDPYFEVSDFCEAVGVSKSLLNKKLQGLVGQSAGEFIRNYRLNTAHELILANRKTKQMYIAEIAYEVGFNDPKYFARCFNRHFNMKPSDLMNRED